MIDSKQIQEELGRFADLDSEMQTVVLQDEILVRFTQLGDPVELRINSSGGRTVERRAGNERRHASYRGLLASEGFGNLRRFVEAQRGLLGRDAPYLFRPELQLPVSGTLDVLGEEDASDLVIELDDWLASRNRAGEQRAVVIDGPAGVGKTHVIRSICHRRISSFGPGSRPLLLHVQSRGRKLTTLNDVIAGTLNILRVPLTFEQLPILIRHGLMDVAIDGFDELADPNGYETAWASLRDFVEDIAGEGVVLLAGRDTFIDRDQIRKVLPRLNTSELRAAHLKPLPPARAETWFGDRGMSPEAIVSLREAGLMDAGAYSLRPFYVLQISKAASEGRTLDDFLENPLQSLVDALVIREAGILAPLLSGFDVERIADLLGSFLQEVAREMGDGERDWVDFSALSLLSDLVFSEVVAADEAGMLRHRVHTIALLEPDVENGRRRFPHGEVQDYFMACSYLQLIGSGEIPKSVRRNILGKEFLETFHDVALTKGMAATRKFLKTAAELVRSTRFDDRTRTNLAALLLALPGEYLDQGDVGRITSVTLDEACIRGTAAAFNLFDVFIAQMDCRGADVSSLTFERSSIGSLLVEDSSYLSPAMPLPASLMIAKNGGIHSEYNALVIREWMDSHGPAPERVASPSEALELLDKLCRVMLRQNWIRGIDEDRAGRSLASPYWPGLREELEGAGLLKVRSGVQVGGPRSEFFRIHRARELLQPDALAPKLVALRSRVAALG